MKKLLIMERPPVQALALLEDELLTEYEESPSFGKVFPPPIGSVVLGRIQQIEPALSAALVDIGMEEPAFMPLDKSREKISYSPGTELPVQIKRYPEGLKATTVSHQISLQGRYVVLTSGDIRIGVSSKIRDSSLRERLYHLGNTFPGIENVGYILRTESAAASDDAILREAERLLCIYQEISQKVRYSREGDLLYREQSFVTNYLLARGIGAFDALIFENSKLLKEVQEQLSLRQMDLPEGVFQLFSGGGFSLAEVYRIQTQLNEALSERVPVRPQGSLVIQPTEALISIDVNSGHLPGKKEKEIAIRDFNLQVIPEIVRQIRLRNLSGMIVIDFIHMKEEEDRILVTDALIQEFRKDSHQVSIYGFTKMQLMEVVREKSGLPLKDFLRHTN